MKYEKMHLTDLRRYARAIGVKSPTTCNKDVLIKKIVEIETGLQEPYFSKMGRPILVENKDVTEKIVEASNMEKKLYVDVLLSIVRKSIDYLTEMEECLSILKNKE